MTKRSLGYFEAMVTARMNMVIPVWDELGADDEHPKEYSYASGLISAYQDVLNILDGKTEVPITLNNFLNLYGDDDDDEE